MTVVGVGVDLVHVPSFVDQLDLPGPRVEGVFLPGELRDARGRTTDPGRHLAARWAAKEAVVKAWSASMHGEVARHLTGHALEVSLSHDGDYAIAYVILTRP